MNDSPSVRSCSVPPGEAGASAKAYSLKGFVFTMLTMSLKIADVGAIRAQLSKERDASPDLLNEPLVVDLQDVAAADAVPDFGALFAMLREEGITPVGVCNGNPVQQAAARALGL